MSDHECQVGVLRGSGRTGRQLGSMAYPVWRDFRPVSVRVSASGYKNGFLKKEINDTWTAEDILRQEG